MTRFLDVGVILPGGKVFPNVRSVSEAVVRATTVKSA